MAKKFGDVVVIGGGIAGLTAAAVLSRAGVAVTLLEGRERLGGRILTHREEGVYFPVELGAEFMHGREEYFSGLVSEAGIRLCDVNDKRWLASDGNIELQAGYFERQAPVLEQLFAHAQTAEVDESIVQFGHRLLKQSPELQGAFDEMAAEMELFNATVPQLTSIKFLAQAQDATDELGGASYRLIDGYDQVVNYVQNLCKTVTINMSTTVKKISWSRGSVAISAVSAGGETTSNFAKAVIAVPVAVLKGPKNSKAFLEFDPPLAEKNDALKGFGIGNAKRIVVRFAFRFWERAEDFEFGFINCPSAPIPMWWSQKPLNSPVLMGWVAGNRAASVGLVKSKLRQQVVESLATIFGLPPSEIDGMIKGVYFHDWMNDPYSRGAFTYGLVGGIASPEILAKPVDETLYFAGDSTDGDGMTGSVHGAIRSGIRAAEELLGGSP